MKKSASSVTATPMILGRASGKDAHKEDEPNSRRSSKLGSASILSAIRRYRSADTSSPVRSMPIFVRFCSFAADLRFEKKLGQRWLAVSWSNSSDQAIATGVILMGSKTRGKLIIQSCPSQATDWEKTAKKCVHARILQRQPKRRLEETCRILLSFSRERIKYWRPTIERSCVG